MKLDKALYERTHAALQGMGRTPPYVVLRGVTAFLHQDGPEEEQVYPEDLWPGQEVVLRVDPDEPDRRQQRWRVAHMVAEGFFVPKDEYDPNVHGGPWKTREEYDREKESREYGGVDKAAFQAAVSSAVAQALAAFGIDPSQQPAGASPAEAPVEPPDGQ